MKYFVYSLIALLQIGFLCNAAQVGFYKVGYVVNIPNNSSSYYSVALQPDGKIVAVGGTDDNNGLIARFNPDGKLDESFNAAGTPGYIDNLPDDSSIYRSVTLDSQGRIILVGQTDLNNNDSNGIIVRLKSDGTLDDTFNNTGFINTEEDYFSFSYYSVAVDRQDKIIVVGVAELMNEGYNGFIARFNTDGSLDTTTFNTGSVNGGPGYINADGVINSFGYYAVAINSQGSIIVVGETDLDLVGNNSNGIIARFSSSGILDTTTFNTGSVNGGPGYINIRGATNSRAYFAVAINAQEKIIAAGITNDTNGVIVRFNPDGSLDQTFNNGAGFITNVPNTSEQYYSVALQPDGKIVAVGGAELNGGVDGLIARFLSKGVLDAESNWNLQNFRESNNINNVSIALLG